VSSLPPPLSPPPDCLTKLHEGHRAKGVQQAVQHDAQGEVDQAQVRVKHSLHAMHTMHTMHGQAEWPRTASQSVSAPPGSRMLCPAAPLACCHPAPTRLPAACLVHRQRVCPYLMGQCEE
jgi:hypothetical protein